MSSKAFGAGATMGLTALLDAHVDDNALNTWPFDGFKVEGRDNIE